MTTNPIAAMQAIIDERDSLKTDLEALREELVGMRHRVDASGYEHSSAINNMARRVGISTYDRDTVNILDDLSIWVFSMAGPQNEDPNRGRIAYESYFENDREYVWAEASHGSNISFTRVYDACAAHAHAGLVARADRAEAELTHIRKAVGVCHKSPNDSTAQQVSKIMKAYAEAIRHSGAVQREEDTKDPVAVCPVDADDLANWRRGLYAYDDERENEVTRQCLAWLIDRERDRTKLEGGK